MMRQLKKHTKQPTKPMNRKSSTFVQYRQEADSLRAMFGQPTTYSVRGLLVGNWAVTEVVGLAHFTLGEMVGFAPLDAGQTTTPETGRIGTKGLPKGWAPASLIAISSPFGVMFSPRTVGLNGLPNWQGTIPLVDKWSTNSPLWEAPPAGAFLSEPSPGSPGMRGLTPRAGEILKHLQEVHGGTGWKIGGVVIGGIQHGMPPELEKQLSDELREAFAIVRHGGFTKELLDILNWAWVDLPKAATQLGIPPQYEVIAVPRQVAMPSVTPATVFADPRPRGIAYASVKTFESLVFPSPPVTPPLVPLETAVVPPPPAPPLIPLMEAAEVVMPPVMEVLYSIRLRGAALSPAYTAKTREETSALFEGMGDDISHFELMVTTSPGRWVHPAMAGF